MATTECVINATPDQVFAVLADGWTYSDWVVGTAHIRDVDRDYPMPGTMIHHKAGPWPFAIKHVSTVLDCEQDRMLLLRVGLWPLGEAMVRLDLTPIGTSATRVTMREHFTQGPSHWLQNKATDLVVHQRNKESLRRLGDLATRRASVHHG
ncbi:SRPBCC family protein [Planosporangium thailandense]|uniref:SRPBCC family protein n=1 Tax=Planosporangium thailandense TaxID=765197 RepID=A0ABX0XWV7_9ACTN|nr:SRPBCC family protein [Planosporangium thailandense]